jgi:hypothetical protein
VKTAPSLAGEGFLRERGDLPPLKISSPEKGALKRGFTPLHFLPPFKQKIFRIQIINLFERGIRG